MKYTNYHTHTKFCDGSSEPEEYIKQAIAFGIESLGFSAHAPVPFENAWSLEYADLDEYCKTINSLKYKYDKQINIHLGLEMDYIPGVTDDFDLVKTKNELDYIIGSIHLVKNKDCEELWFIDGPEIGYINGIKEIFDNNGQLAVEAFYAQTNEMIEKFKPEVIGHLDKVKMNNRNRFFDRSEKWYLPAIMSTLETVKKHESIIEVNTRGIYKGKTEELFPDISILKIIHEMKIPVTISTDAHKPTELISYFDETVEILKQVGFKNMRIFDGKSWIERSLDTI